MDLMRFGINPFAVFPVFPFCVTSLMLISGLKFVANGFPWSLHYNRQYRDNEVHQNDVRSPGCKTDVTPGSNPHPSIAVRPAFLYLPA